MGVTITTQLLPHTICFLINYETRLIRAEWLLGIRTAIRLNSVIKAKQIAENLGDELSKITSELFIYERYQFQLLLKGESVRKGSIPIEYFPNKVGRGLNYIKLKPHEGFGSDLEED